jgi:hypothetical protein
MIGMWGIAIVVGLYTTFVLQMLWNWFAVDALRAPEISYWTVYGLLLLIRLIFEKPTLESDEKFKRLAILVEACVPQEKKAEVENALKTEDDDMWVKLGIVIFGEVAGSSIALGIGFAIHSFLS